MPPILNPYLHFRGNAREAMEFYHNAFGGKLSMTTFKEYQASPSPSDDNLIMHAQLDTDHGMTLMASDAFSGAEIQPGGNFSISLSGDNEAELTGYFEKLSAGGTVTQPLVRSNWGDVFGMLTDRFGVEWMVNIGPKRT